jgi:hypothetical protein
MELGAILRVIVVRSGRSHLPRIDIKESINLAHPAPLTSSLKDPLRPLVKPQQIMKITGRSKLLVKPVVQKRPV